MKMPARMSVKTNSFVEIIATISENIFLGLYKRYEATSLYERILAHRRHEAVVEITFSGK